MSNLHVVYRLDDLGTASEQWSAYSYPVSIYTAGTALDEVRAEFRAAAGFTLGEGFDSVTVVEHIERPLISGVYLRTAIDRRTLDRDEVASVMRRSLAVPQQRQDFVERVPASSTGDAVVIACVAGDRLGWVFEQMTDTDAVALCSTGPALGGGQLMWWSFLVGYRARPHIDEPTETLADAGLTSDSTVSEFSQASNTATGRMLVDSVAV